MQETQEIWVQSLGPEDLLEEEMATQSSILTWKIPWAEEPGRLQSMGSQRVRHDWARTHAVQQSRVLTEVVQQWYWCLRIFVSFCCAVMNCSSFILMYAATVIGGAQRVCLGSSFKRGLEGGYKPFSLHRGGGLLPHPRSMKWIIPKHQRVTVNSEIDIDIQMYRYDKCPQCKTLQIQGDVGSLQWCQWTLDPVETFQHALRILKAIYMPRKGLRHSDLSLLTDLEGMCKQEGKAKGESHRPGCWGSWGKVGKTCGFKEFKDIWYFRKPLPIISSTCWLRQWIPVWATGVRSLGWEDTLEGMATHSSILAWRIPWTEEPVTKDTHTN